MNNRLEQIISDKYELLKPFLDEQRRRLFVAAEAISLGAGGISIVSRATGVNRETISKGCKELESGTTGEIGLEISVCHFLPGTSKWNKIEHRLFSHITLNWRGKPLTNCEVIVNLIAATTTSKGLKVKCMLDKNEHPKGINITKEGVEGLGIFRDEFHGEWNYMFKPRNKGVA